MEIKSEEFVLNRTIYIYDINCEYHDKYHNEVIIEGNVSMDLHLIFHMTLLKMKLLHVNI